MPTFPKRKRKPSRRGSDPNSVGKELRASGSDPKSVGKHQLKPLGKLLGRQKRKRKTVMKEPPYKVLFPGYRDHSTSNSPYNLKDPRLGNAQRNREAFFKSRRLLAPSEFGDYDGTSEVGSDSGTEAEDNSNVPTEVVTVRIDERTPFPKPSEAEMAAMEEQRKLSQKRFYRRLVRNEAQMLKKRDCKCAEAAVRFYNEKHDTKYEIVETLGSYGSLSIGFWFHCNFRAECKSGTGLGYPKLFFAELNRKRPNVLEVIDCKILDDPGYCVNTVLGCKMCPGPLLHPINGFKVGK